MSATIMAIGVAIPFTVLGDYLGFTQLPMLYWPLLAVSLLAYIVITQLLKMWTWITYLHFCLKSMLMVPKMRCLKKSKIR